NGDGAADSDFQPNGGAIVMDVNDPGRGTACGRVTLVDPATPQLGIDIQSDTLGAAGATPLLLALPAPQYRRAHRDHPPRDGIVLSEGVEDLQVAYFFDADGDNQIDAGEVKGDGVGPDYVAKNQDASKVRQVRVDLVARTRAEDPTWSQGKPQATENRTPVAAPDGLRRRVDSTTPHGGNAGSRGT